jgi:hypothetical protein
MSVWISEKSKKRLAEYEAGLPTAGEKTQIRVKDVKHGGM